MYTPRAGLSSIEEERIRQLEEGAKLAEQDQSGSGGRITLRHPYNRQQRLSQQDYDRQDDQLRRRTGHEVLLKGLENSKALVQFELLDDPEPVIGRIRTSDATTISVVLENGNGKVVIFKHALRLFRPMNDQSQSAFELAEGDQ